jgi:hypothetical protein
MRLFELPRPAFELLKRRMLFFRSSASPSDAVARALLRRDFISPGAENADTPSEQAPGTMEVTVYGMRAYYSSREDGGVQ